MHQLRNRRIVLGMVACAALALACGSEPSSEPSAPETPTPSEAQPEATPGQPQLPKGASMPESAAAQLAKRAASIFGTLPDEAVVPEGKEWNGAHALLGRKLYYEKRLSVANDVSCNDCHLLDKFGVDGTATSTGHKGQRGDRNAPTVYNASLHLAQFWDGRAEDLEEQAKGPILNPVEMAMPSEEAVIRKLRGIQGYEQVFKMVFPGEADPLTYDNLAIAIGAFERKLLTPSRFDDFMEGNLLALSKEEQAGLQTFMDLGCTTCHAGPAVGGQMYQKIGLINDYETSDLGRYKLTGREADKYVFKVPSLRNIAKTGPYFHDGSVKTLAEAVQLMAHHQLGIELKPEQEQSILAFLESLTGEIDWQYITEPTMNQGEG